MLKPIAVVGGLFAFVTVLATVGSLPVAAIILAPLVLGGLLYYRGRDNQGKSPPRF
jgi:hypothetical protein